MNLPKYRAWHKQLKKMMPVLQIDLDPEHGGVFVESNDGHYCGCRLNMELWPWDDIELIQFTGLQDRTGKDIYEDDLLLYRYPTGELIFRAVIGEHTHDVDGQDYTYYGLYFIWENETTSGMGTEHISLSKMEVIGNIWENSNLLLQEQ